MWIVELGFTDAAERLAARPAHRRRLEDLHRTGGVRMAGPFADDSGAMIIFGAMDRSTLDRLLAADPYFHAPGVAVRRITAWRPFLPEPPPEP